MRVPSWAGGYRVGAEMSSLISAVVREAMAS